MSSNHKEHYPVLVSKRSDNTYHMEAIDFDDCEVKEEHFHEAISKMAQKLEEITWKKSELNQTIPKPSKIETLSRAAEENETIHYVEVVKRYSELPNILYLYYPINEHLLPMLLDPYIWFSDPAEYNDPFERPDVLEHTWSSEQALKEVRFAVASGKKLGEKWALKVDDVDRFFTKIYLQQTLGFKMILQKKTDVLDSVVQKYRAACLSRNFNNTLMWSHYANKHQGMVIGYDFSSLYDDSFRGSDIDYRAHREKLLAGSFAGSPEEHDIGPYITRKLLTKHPMWSYEQEFRFIKFDEQTQGPKHKLPPSSIKELYLGCRMDNDTKRHISQILRDRNIKHF